MSDHDVATQFHDVVVTLDQTGEQWSGDAAAIEHGKVCVTMSGPIPLPRRGATFTVACVDGGGRKRVFRALSLDAAASYPPHRLIFD